MGNYLKMPDKRRVLAMLELGWSYRRASSARPRPDPGHADHVHLNGVDRWIGGTHLTEKEPIWRYDERLETLIQPSA